MKKTFFLLPLLMIVFSLVAVNLYVALPASANTLKDNITNDLNKVGTTGFNQPIPAADALQQTVGRIIKIVLGFLGVIMVIIVIYAGFLWMTAGGDPEQVKKAKDWMLNATIGLIILISAYTISGFVITKVFEATG